MPLEAAIGGRSGLPKLLRSKPLYWSLLISRPLRQGKLVSAAADFRPEAVDAGLDPFIASSAFHRD
jgi:hypothetical protein